MSRPECPGRKSFCRNSVVEGWTSASSQPKPHPIAAAHAVRAVVDQPQPLHVVHVKRRPRPQATIAPVAAQARFSPAPVASGPTLLSGPPHPPSLCETVHRGVGEPAPGLVSFPPGAAEAPSAEGPGNSVTEAAIPSISLPEPWTGGSVEGSPPGAIGSEILSPPPTPGNGEPTVGILPISPIPERSEWGLMLVGIGAVGYGLRSRRRSLWKPS